VYGLSGLVERWRIKCSEKVATWVVFSGTKMEDDEQ
jgi:hypothetical protein